MSWLRSNLPWVWTGVIVFVALGVFLAGLVFLSPGDVGEVAGAAVLLLPVLFTALGALIATRNPGNRISWLLFVIGVGFLVATSAGVFSEADPSSQSPSNYFALVAVDNAALSGVFYPLFLVLFLFPDGRFLTRGWSWAGWMGAVFVPAVLLTSVFAEERSGDFGESWVSNPIGFIPTSVSGTVDGLWIGGLVVLGVGGVVALIVRYRRSTAVVRAQIRWLLYAAALTAVSFVLIVFGIPGEGILFTIELLVVVTAIPTAITVAIARYRLFEIDRLISRTVSYAIVIGLLAVVYAAGVFLITELFSGQSDIAVAASTLAAAALFTPIRRRVQRVVDRRFNRSRYDTEQIVADFTARLRSQTDLETLTSEWVSVVNDTVQPQSVSVWVKEQPD